MAPSVFPRAYLIVCLTLLLTAACGKKRTSASAPRNAPARAAAVPGATQVGLASWYGEPYHGRRAANGEVYDMNKLTAAHRTLPFDTLVDVLNLENQRQVQVRINDRGPFIEGRIIDLSRAAAKEIAMLGPGVVQVRLRVVGTTNEEKSSKPHENQPASPEPSPAESPADVSAQPTGLPAEAGGGERSAYAVQLGAFSEVKTAEKLQKRMASRYGGAYIENVRSDKGLLYRVRVGPTSTLAEAERVAVSLERENFRPLVVRVSLPHQN